MTKEDPLTPIQHNTQEGDVERVCAVCTATVAHWPDVMCCHCVQVPWQVTASLTSQPSDDVEREAIVKWLRNLNSGDADNATAGWLARLIERGDHLSQQPSNGGGE